MKRSLILMITALIMLITTNFVSADALTGTTDVYTTLELTGYQITQNQQQPILNLHFAYGDNVTVDNVLYRAYLDGTPLGNYTIMGNESTIVLPYLYVGTHSIRLEVVSIPRINIIDFVTNQTIALKVGLNATQNMDAVTINKGEVGKVVLTITNTGNVPLRVTAALLHASTLTEVTSQLVEIPAKQTVEVVLGDDPQVNTDYIWKIYDDKVTFAQGEFRIIVLGGGAIPAIPAGGVTEMPTEVEQYLETQEKYNNIIFYVIGEVFGYKIQLWMPFALLTLYGLAKNDKNLVFIGAGTLAFFYFASPWLLSG